MREIDLSIKDEYYSQVNNKFVPLEACMPTSFIMGLIYNGISVVPSGNKTPVTFPAFVFPKSLQPEDYLLAICRSPWGELLRNEIPWARGKDIPPNQLHEVISKIVNDIVGSTVTKFVTNVSIEDLIALIKKGKSVVTSGAFTGSGHAVVACGLRENGDDVSSILVDDPYGDYFTNYKVKQGNNIWFPVDKFKLLWSSWYHVFDKNGVF